MGEEGIQNSGVRIQNGKRENRNQNLSGKQEIQENRIEGRGQERK